MIGRKQRNFAPLINVSLENLVPADHFYQKKRIRFIQGLLANAERFQNEQTTG
jgi:hypothetical protein